MTRKRTPGERGTRIPSDQDRQLCLLEYLDRVATARPEPRVEPCAPASSMPEAPAGADLPSVMPAGQAPGTRAVDEPGIPSASLDAPGPGPIDPFETWPGDLLDVEPERWTAPDLEAPTDPWLAPAAELLPDSAGPIDLLQPSAPEPPARRKPGRPKGGRASQADAVAVGLLAAMVPGVPRARSELQEGLAISEALCRKALELLIEQGLVTREGERRGARYLLSEAGVQRRAENAADGTAPPPADSGNG